VLDVLWDSDLPTLLSGTTQEITVPDSIRISRGPNNTADQSFMSEVTVSLSVAPSIIP
jgi:hypothetical protein